MVTKPRKRDEPKVPARARVSALKLLEDEIGRKLQQSIDAGELQAAESWGKPLADMQGWAETPATLRMAHKVLKNSGNVPAEIGLFHRRARLREQIASCRDDVESQKLHIALSELEQIIALRLEGLRRGRS